MMKKLCPDLIIVKIHLLIGFSVFLSIATLKGQVRAVFSSDKTAGCSPLAIKFTNSSTGVSSGTVYHWDFGNGNTSTLQHPSVIFTEAKSYTVTLTVTEAGKTSTQSTAITVYKKPVIDFSESVTRGCLPLPVNFNANVQPGNGSPTSYHWDFGDGFTSEQTISSVIHTYQTKQPATVSLTVKNNYGCDTTVVKKNLINILPPISSDFDADKKILCSTADPVIFTNKGKGPGTLSYLWDFGNGQTSSDKDPSYIFNSKGIYTVKLTVNSSEGCTATNSKTNYLNVANISTDIQLPALICRNANVSIKSLCTPAPDKIDWEVDGVLHYNHSQELQLPFQTIGNHTVKLTATYGTCQQTVTRSFDVKELPLTSDFEVDVTSSCGSPALVNFKDLSADAVKWEWCFDYQYYGSTVINAVTQTTSNTYKYDQTYQVFLKKYNSDGCSRELIKYVQIYPPIVSIDNMGGNYEGCGPFTTTFKAGAGSQANIVKYNWVFDNNVASSSLAEPTYTFSTVGSHSVKLEYETDKGCKGVAYYNDRIVIRAKPKAEFTSLSGNIICGNTKVSFLDQSTGASGGYQYWYINGMPAGYLWYNRLDYQFSEKGKYTITLIADNYGCRDTITKTDYIEVLPPFPKINSVQNFCDDRGQVVFSQASRYAEKWVWDFGDGQSEMLTAEQASITHHYATSGAYKVVLTTTNGQCSVRDSTIAYVQYPVKPLITADKSSICSNEPLWVTVTNLPPAVNPNYQDFFYMEKWEYGDGTTLNNYNYWLSPPYPRNIQLYGFDPNKNQLRLIVKQSFFGCLDTSNYIPVTVKGSTAGFQFLNNNICFNSTIELKDNSTISPGGSIKNWEWDFGDGQRLNKSTPENVTHSYAGPGSYSVSLRITDDIGCISTTAQATQYARINGPKAIFTASAYTVPVNSTVFFYNSTNDYSYYRATYKWDFGNGNIATSYNTQQSFSTVGKYIVKLVATDPVTGCTSEATQTITVEPVKSNFSFTKAYIGQTNCIPLLASFSAISVNADSLSWDFGDGNIAGDLRYPKHIYEKPGKYIITLTARGANGIILKYIDSITITQPEVVLTAGKTEGCAGHSVVWDLTGSNTAGYLWDFGDGNTAPAQEGATAHSYSIPGTYSPTLVLKDANGCLVDAKINDKITIHQNPDINIAPPIASACLGQPLQLKASGAETYIWTPSTGLDDPLSASPYASPVQTTNYKVEATDKWGCKNTTDFTLTIHQPFDIQVSSQVTICEGEQTVLNAAGADHYKWINTTAGLNNLQSNAPIALPSNTTQYSVVGYDKFGCFTDTANILVTVNPRPTVNAGNDVEVQPGDQVKLSATGSNDIIGWNWSPSNFLSCSNCVSPIAIPQSEMKYGVKVTNNYGCAATDEVVIKMQCDESRVRIPNAFSPNGDGKNDLFVIKGISVIKHMVIFNRWGNKVFEKNNFIASDPSSCWDGKSGSVGLQTDSYVYFIEMQCPTGESFVRKGTVVLVR